MSDFDCACCVLQYVVLSLQRGDGSSQEWRTSTKDSELNPRYGETFDINLTGVDFMGGEHGGRLQWKVWDSNSMADDQMGSCSIQLSQVAKGPQTLQLNGPKTDLSYGALSFTAHHKTAEEEAEAKQVIAERKTRQHQEAVELSKVKEFLHLTVTGCKQTEDNAQMVIEATITRGQDKQQTSQGADDQPGKLQRFEFEIDSSQRGHGPFESTVLFQAWKVSTPCLCAVV